MPRVKPKALSAPPSQEALEDGADSTSLFTSNTVAALFPTRKPARMVTRQLSWNLLLRLDIEDSRFLQQHNAIATLDPDIKGCGTHGFELVQGDAGRDDATAIAG